MYTYDIVLYFPPIFILKDKITDIPQCGSVFNKFVSN